MRVKVREAAAKGADRCWECCTRRKYHICWLRGRPPICSIARDMSIARKNVVWATMMQINVRTSSFVFARRLAEIIKVAGDNDAIWTHDMNLSGCHAPWDERVVGSKEEGQLSSLARRWGCGCANRRHVRGSLTPCPEQKTCGHPVTHAPARTRAHLFGCRAMRTSSARSIHGNTAEMKPPLPIVLCRAPITWT
jgi:hypothetical protein